MTRIVASASNDAKIRVSKKSDSIELTSVTDMAPSMSCLLAKTTRIEPFNSSSFNLKKRDELSGNSLAGSEEAIQEISSSIIGLNDKINNCNNENLFPLLPSLMPF